MTDHFVEVPKKVLSPAAQGAESYELLSEWFKYNTSSPSCLSWKKRPPLEKLWRQEKQAALESIQAAKDLAVNHLALEREKIMRISHQEALQELIHVHKIEGKIRVINAVADTGVLEIR